MSSFLNPSAAPPEATEPAGPQSLAPVPRRFPKWQIGLLVVLVLGAAAAAWFLRGRAQKKRPAAAAVIPTVAVRTGTLDRTVRIAGSTSAGTYADITAPILRGQEGQRGLSLVKLVPAGSPVKKDEILAQLDTSAAKDHIDDVQAMVTQAQSDIRRAQADQAITEESMRQDIRVAKAALDNARLDSGAQEIRTAIDQELLKLTLEEDEAAYREVQNDFQTNVLSQKAAIRVEEIDLIRTQRHLDRHLYDLPHFDIRSPINGLAVMLSLRRGRGADMYQVQEGDQISPRQPFMKVVDPNSIQIDATVNQVASQELRIGQPVTAHFDAFPELAIPGKIYSIGAIAIGAGRGGSAWVRQIAVKVKLARQDPQVIPDLSASADVLVHREQNATLIPRAAVFQDRGKDVVFVKTPTGFSRREVQIGAENNIQTAVTDGLRSGEQVALERPPLASQVATPEMAVFSGVNPVLEALRAGQQFDRIVVARGAGGTRIQEMIELARQAGVPVRFEPRAGLDRLAGSPAHQGVVALGAAARYTELEEVAGQGRLLVLLDGVEDPHNLGAIIRTAHAAGAAAVVVPERRAVGLTDVVGKAAAGALEYLPVVRVGNLNRALEDLKRRGFWIYGLDERGEQCYDRVDYAAPAAIVLGGEGKGLHEQVRKHCDVLVHIPMAGEISSLNVSVAAGVVLFEWRRRQTAP